MKTEEIAGRTTYIGSPNDIGGLIDYGTRCGNKTLKEVVTLIRKRGCPHGCGGCPQVENLISAIKELRS